MSETNSPPISAYLDLSTADGLLWAKPILSALYDEGQHEACLRVGEDTALFHPLDDEVACHRICCLEGLGRYAESDILLKEVLARSPNNRRALYLKGRHSLLNAQLKRVNTGSDDEIHIAEHALRAAYVLNPDYVAGRKDLAQALSEMGRHQEALSLIARVDFASERGVEVRTNGLALLAELYLATAGQTGAIQVTQELAPLMLEHSKSEARGALVVAHAFLMLGRKTEAANWKALGEAINGGQELQKRKAIAACVDFSIGGLPS